MQVSVETTQGLGRKMTVTLPGDSIQTEVQKRLKSLAPQVKLAGFRPGKVPMKVVEKRYGASVRQEVVGEMISNTFYEAASKENIRPAGQPAIEDLKEEADSIQYVATFEVFPEISLGGIEKISIEKFSADITDADLDEMLDKIRGQRKEWSAVERAAATGDRVTVDYKGTINGESFEGGEGELAVEIGMGRMIPGFEDALIGTSAGEQKTIDLSFPEDYGHKEVAGKPVQFALSITKVEESKLPELDDKLAESFGIKEGGVEAFKADVKANMQRELDGVIKRKLKDSVMDALLQSTQFEVPQSMVDSEAQRFAKQLQDQMATQGGQNVDTNLAQSEHVKEQSLRRVSLGLILSEIIKQQNMTADQDKVRAEVDNIAASYGEPKEVVKWYYGDRNRLAEIESVVLEDQVVTWICEQAKVTETKKSFDELVNSMR